MTALLVCSLITLTRPFLLSFLSNRIDYLPVFVWTFHLLTRDLPHQQRTIRMRACVHACGRGEGGGGGVVGVYVRAGIVCVRP